VIVSGAVGIEMAAELKLMMPDQKITLIHSRDRLLSAEPLPEEFKESCRTIIEQGGVNLILGQRVVETKSSRTDDGDQRFVLRLANGTEVTAGHVIHAISKSLVSSSFMPTEALDEEGHVKITPAYAPI
jgi:NADH dehydrogenase FAD-containing subunit